MQNNRSHLTIFGILFVTTAFILAASTISASGSSLTLKESPRDEYVNFASSKTAQGRNFQDVILAVHGWHGSCEGTFGKDTNSLFQLLKDKRFYDFDCFAYDTDKTTIKQSSENLLGRLKLLRERGYKKVMLITHSTGGVVFLQMICDIFLDENGKRRSALDVKKELDAMPFLVPSSLWATPINGLTPLLGFFGIAYGTLTGNDAVLNDLKSEDTEFLESLRTRMADLTTAYNSENDEISNRYRKIKFNFFHGEGNDHVVKAIGSNPQPKWFACDRDRLIITESFHTDNIGNPGRDWVNYYSGEITKNEILLNIKPEPRFELLFRKSSYNSLNLSDSIIKRQQMVIDGIIDYSKLQGDNLNNASDALTDLLSKLLDPQGPRSKEVDGYTVDKLQKLFPRKQYGGSEDDRSFIRANLAMLSKLRDYQPPQLGDDFNSLAYFGHNASNITSDLLSLGETLFKNSIDFASRNSGKLPDGSISDRKELEKAYLELLSKFMVSVHDPVRVMAIEKANDAIPDLTNTEQIDRILLTSVSNALSRKKLTLDEKRLIATLFISAAKNAELRKQVFHHLNKTTTVYYNDYPPAWVMLADDSVVSKLMALIELQPFPSEDELKFLFNVALRAGASGNNPGIAKEALRQLVSVIKIVPQVRPDLQSQYRDQLNEVGEDNAAYPNIFTNLKL